MWFRGRAAQAGDLGSPACWSVLELWIWTNGSVRVQPEKQIQEETYIKGFIAKNWGMARRVRSIGQTIRRGSLDSQTAEAAVHRQNVLFGKASALLARPFNWLSQTHTDYLGSPLPKVT